MAGSSAPVIFWPSTPPSVASRNQGWCVAIPSSDAASQDAPNGAAVEPFEDLRAHSKTFQLPEGEEALLCLLHDYVGDISMDARLWEKIV